MHAMDIGLCKAISATARQNKSMASIEFSGRGGQHEAVAGDALVEWKAARKSRPGDFYRLQSVTEK